MKMKLSITIIMLGILATMMNDSMVVGKDIPAQNSQNNTVIEAELQSPSETFAFKCYQDALENANPADDNLVVSPLMEMVQINSLVNATETSSLSELLKFLNFKGNKQQWHDTIKPVLQQYKGVQELQIANGIWVSKGYQIQKSFIEQCAKQFQLQVTAVDFTNPATVTTINNWFANKTNNQIPKLFDTIDPTVKLILGNALFFHGQWEKEFKTESSGKGFFTTFNGENILWKIMDQEDLFYYANTSQCQVLKMNYSNDRFYMLVFMPNEVNTFQQFEKSLSAQMVNECEALLKQQFIRVRFPKFTVKGKLDMVPILKKNGVKTIFGKLADFSPMTISNDIEISKMTQQITLSVDEKGTTAAVASTSEFIPKAITPHFYADHPFVYVIKDKQTNQILFIGRFVNPQGNGIVKETSQSVKENAAPADKPVATPAQPAPAQPEAAPADKPVATPAQPAPAQPEAKPADKPAATPAAAPAQPEAKPADKPAATPAAVPAQPAPAQPEAKPGFMR